MQIRNACTDAVRGRPHQPVGYLRGFGHSEGHNSIRWLAYRDANGVWFAGLLGFVRSCLLHSVLDLVGDLQDPRYWSDRTDKSDSDEASGTFVTLVDTVLVHITPLPSRLGADVLWWWIGRRS